MTSQLNQDRDILAALGRAVASPVSAVERYVCLSCTAEFNRSPLTAHLCPNCRSDQITRSERGATR